MNEKPLIGLHVSIEKSLDLAFDRASELGCNTFQMFTRNPRIWKFKPLSDETIKSFRDKRKRTDFRYLVDHMPYLPNLASSLKETTKKSRDALDEEVRRCDSLGLDYLVVHLGSHGGKGTKVGIRNIANAVNHAIEGSDGRTVVLLENMAGQKNCVGARFEELRELLDMVDDSKRVGICLDTCHVYAAGFDLTSVDAVERVLGLFEELVGMKELKVLHLNDSKGAIGSHLDRHEHVGMGHIGREGVRAILAHKGILERPIIMENPIDDLRGQAEDLRFVRKLLPDGKS